MPARAPAKQLTRLSGQRTAGRGRRGVGLIAIHESVGITNAWDLALFCERQGVSYNACADLDQIIYTVSRSDTAWHLRNGNPVADGLCLTTPVRGYSREEWLGPQFAKVEYAAWWSAGVAHDRGLPLNHLSHEAILAVMHGDTDSGGVITHNDYTLATGDGTHTDPRGYPMDVHIALARELATGQPNKPAKPATDKDSEMSEVQLTIRPDLTFRATVMAETKTHAASESIITFGSTWGKTTFKLTPLAAGKAVKATEQFDVPNNGNDFYLVPEGTRMVTIEGKAEHADTIPAAGLWVIR